MTDTFCRVPGRHWTGTRFSVGQVHKFEFKMSAEKNLPALKTGGLLYLQNQPLRSAAVW
jgi:hypothetical protein